MAQHRMAAILLFVVLSLGCSAVEFNLQPDGGHCKINHHCQTGCCYRYSRKSDGICVHPCLHHPCYGPVNGDGCFQSHECFSGCCHTADLVKEAKCVPEDSKLKCFGRGDGDLCTANDNCNSGCCRRTSNWDAAGRCQPKATEGQTCKTMPTKVFYEYICPCESGLECKREVYGISYATIGVCKKPKHGK